MPRGLSGTGFPHILCFSSSLKYLVTVFWWTFPELFYRCETTILQPNGWSWGPLRAMSTWTQASWSLRTDDGNPCDTILLPHHHAIREMCTSRLHTLQPTSFTWLFKILCQNPSGSSGLFRAWDIYLFTWSCNKPFSAPSSGVWVYLASLSGGHVNLR